MRKSEAFIMGFSLFRSWAQKSPEAQFWAWFEKNQDMLYYFERDQERIFDQLGAAMHKVHPDLTFEFGPDKDGKREFVISADGLKAGFPAVESLHAAAPSLPRWTFIKFRPRQSPMQIEIGELKIKPEDVEVAVEADGAKAGFTAFVRGFDNAREKQFSQAVYLLLDHAVGEYDMETKVGFIVVKAFDEELQRRRHSLATLPAVLDEFLGQ
jgi:hypothetical protein